MNSTTKNTITELTDHVLDRVSSLPVVPVDGVVRFVRAWLDHEQPDIANVTPRDAIVGIVRNRINERLAPVTRVRGGAGRISGEKRLRPLG